MTILSVQTLTADTTPDEIQLPNASSVGGTLTKIAYYFDGSNTNDVELVQDSGDTTGLKIPADTERVSGDYMLTQAPKYLYAASSTSIRVTVVRVE